MATVNLNAVWIGLQSDLGAQISAGSMGSMGESSTSGSLTALARSDVVSSTGTVTQYANGVYRNVTTVGQSEAYQCTLRALTAAQVQTLEGWANQLCLVRDRVGRRIWGTFPGIATGDYMGGSQLHDVSLTFTSMSFSDQV